MILITSSIAPKGKKPNWYAAYVKSAFPGERSYDQKYNQENHNNIDANGKPIKTGKAFHILYSLFQPPKYPLWIIASSDLILSA